MTTPKERGRTDRNLNFQVFDVRKEEELLCNCAGRRRERRRWGEVALHVREAGGRRDGRKREKEHMHAATWETFVAFKM